MVGSGGASRAVTTLQGPPLAATAFLARLLKRLSPLAALLSFPCSAPRLLRAPKAQRRLCWTSLPCCACSQAPTSILLTGRALSPRRGRVLGVVLPLLPAHLSPRRLGTARSSIVPAILGRAPRPLRCRRRPPTWWGARANDGGSGGLRELCPSMPLLRSIGLRLGIPASLRPKLKLARRPPLARRVCAIASSGCVGSQFALLVAARAT